MPLPLKPIRKGPFCQVPRRDGSITWIVYGSYQGPEQAIGKYLNESDAIAAYQEYVLCHALQTFDPPTSEQIQHLHTAARQYPILASFLTRLLRAWQPLRFPPRRAIKRYVYRKEPIR